MTIFTNGCMYYYLYIDLICLLFIRQLFTFLKHLYCFHLLVTYSTTINFFITLALLSCDSYLFDNYSHFHNICIASICQLIIQQLFAFITFMSSICRLLIWQLFTFTWILHCFHLPISYLKTIHFFVTSALHSIACHLFDNYSFFELGYTLLVTFSEFIHLLDI